jgi:hypothetical protein
MAARRRARCHANTALAARERVEAAPGLLATVFAALVQPKISRLPGGKWVKHLHAYDELYSAAPGRTGSMLADLAIDLSRAGATSRAWRAAAAGHVLWERCCRRWPLLAVLKARLAMSSKVVIPPPVFFLWRITNEK